MRQLSAQECSNNSGVTTFRRPGIGESLQARVFLRIPGRGLMGQLKKKCWLPRVWGGGGVGKVLAAGPGRHPYRQKKV